MPSLLQLLTFLLVLLLAPIALGQDEDTVFSGGNRAYEDKRFDDAEKVYRKLVDQGMVSEELFYNLGNTLFRSDRPGEAALWYRRALVIDPRFAEARQNLVVVKNRTGYHEFTLGGVDAWLSRMERGEIIALLSTGLWLTALSIAAVFTVPRLKEWRPLLYLVAGMSLVLATGSIWGLRRQAEKVTMEDLAIVIANDAVARTEPVPDSEMVVELPPGSELQIIQRRGPWTYVGIPDELRGWVRTEAIAPVHWYGPHGAPDAPLGVAVVR